jgi:hypothetical protein
MTVSLKALFDETIVHDTTRLPDYQREYVWDGEQQKSLIASFFNAPCDSHAVQSSDEAGQQGLF